MAGNKQKKETLNHTLSVIVRLLHANGFKKWFIGYGTLLGIVREHSCIEGDDDVDIVICQSEASRLKEMLVNNNFSLQIGSKTIVKTRHTAEYASIDFYLAPVDEEGSFHDKHDDILWSKCYTNVSECTLIQVPWRGQTLFLPNNFEKKLENCYGDWKIPQMKKGKRGSKL